MDGYRIAADATDLCPPDYFPIDDLLDFSNEDLFSSSSSSSSSSSTDLPPPPPPPDHRFNSSITNITNANYLAHSVDFTSDLFLPSDDVAELEWLSRFVDDSFTDLPNNCLTINIPSDKPPLPAASKSRTKRSKPPNQLQQEPSPRVAEEGDGGVRRCTHCTSEKTPQWRTGPLGPKTLCNACGVRYKSGRLVPEYRPAASPTFVLTQHSNSHRKVLELRRQNESLKQHQQNFGVC